ncbi:sugar ABC transporter substrate-binding protein [Paenibacillus sp.]|uniref:ABC transporter substrate-binding protein n=1 Tax=Paenibacillus sp. TaxID=58172 RepID=UPI002810C262|nr:sugar ABC transporter substrate-binding protein [Paenibacillus sp.]
MKKAKSSKVIFILTLVLALLVVSACSSNSTGNEPAPADQDTNIADESAPTTDEEPVVEEDKTPVTIKFTNWANSETYNKVNEAFMKKYPWITVEFVYSGEKGPQGTVEASIAAGDPIDVYFDGSLSGNLKSNLAEDLTPYIEKDEEFKNYPFLEGIMEQFNVDGKQWALPRGTEAFLVFYNKDLLEEYGLEKPSNDWTWEQMREMAMKATDPAKGRFGLGGDGIFYMFGSPVLPMANGHAPNLYALDETKTKSLADQPDVMDDLQWFADLALKDKVLLNKATSEANNIKEDRWSTGNALFTIHVSPLMETWDKSLEFNWDVLPFPAGTSKQVGIMWNQPLMMTKASKHKDAVWKFMKFYTTSPEAQQIFMERATLLPNSKDANMKEVLTSLPFYAKYDVNAILYAVDHAVPDPSSYMKGGNLVTASFNEWVANKLINESMSAYDYFPAATEKLNNDLAAQ